MVPRFACAVLAVVTHVEAQNPFDQFKDTMKGAEDAGTVAGDEAEGAQNNANPFGRFGEALKGAIDAFKDKANDTQNESKNPFDLFKDAMKGAKDAGKVAGDKAKDLLEQCKGKSGEELRACRNDQGKQLREAMGGGRRDHKQAGAEVAMKIIAACVEEANTMKAKMACGRNQDVKDSFASILGLGAGNITDGMLREVVMDRARGKLKLGLQSCFNKSFDEVRVCIGNVTALGEGDLLGFGMSAKEAKQKARHLIEGAMKWATQEKMKACRMLSGSAKTMCQKEMRENFAWATGVSIDKVSDRLMKKAADDALAAAITDVLEECALNETMTKEECTKMVEAELADAGYSLDTQTVLAWIARATEAEAKSFLLNCVKSGENAKACMDQGRELMDKIRGKTQGLMNKRGEAVWKNQEKEALKNAAAEAVKDAMDACRALKASSSDAECEDELELFQQMRGMVGSLSEKMKKTLRSEMAEEVAKHAEKSRQVQCFRELNATSIKECLGELRADEDSVLSAAFAHMSSFDFSKKKNRLREQATWETMGDLFTACMESSNETADGKAKTVCMEELKATYHKVKVAADSQNLEKLETVIFRNAARKLANAVGECSADEAATCREEAMQGFLAMGGKRRKYAMTQAIGLFRALAELKAQCLEGGNTEADCDEQAKDAWVMKSGVQDTAGWSEMANKITALVDAIVAGTPTVINFLDKLVAKIGFPGVTCNVTTQDGQLDKLKEALALVETLTNETLGDRVTPKACRIEFNTTFYTFNLLVPNLSDKPDSEDYVDDVTTAYESASNTNTSRRLEEEGETYIAQETEEVADSSWEGPGNDDGPSSGAKVVAVGTAAFSVLFSMM